MSPRLVPRMMRTAVEPFATVAAISSSVVCELSASCTSPLAISEQKHTGHHWHHTRKADRRKRHVRTVRDWSQNQADDEAREERAGRGAQSEHAQSHPSESVSAHAYRHRPGQHLERRGEKDAVAGDSKACGNDVFPQLE